MLYQLSYARNMQTESRRFGREADQCVGPTPALDWIIAKKSLFGHYEKMMADREDAAGRGMKFDEDPPVVLRRMENMTQFAKFDSAMHHDRLSFLCWVKKLKKTHVPSSAPNVPYAQKNERQHRCILHKAKAPAINLIGGAFADN